jgi:predicted dehydrogenase
VSRQIRFGILSTAKIGRKYVIPALQKASLCEVAAIASRNIERAEETAGRFSIPKAYGSYEELLADPDLDAVYIPLPNHMHVPWTLKALEAGKHVLCEKPIAMNADEARHLKRETERFPDLKVMEAFMYRHHPRWKRVKEIVDSGMLGEIKAVHSFFSYFNENPDDYRNSADMGGGGLMDVGCYSVSVSRLVYARQPDRVFGASEMDPTFGTDRLTSGLLDFGSGTSVFTCSTRCEKDQYVKIYGTTGMLTVEMPFNPDFSKKTHLHLRIEGKQSTESFDPCDHFALQGDAFARAILEEHSVPVSLDDSIGNMEVIDEVRKSA